MNIVFDIGNVLVRWDPHLAFLPVLGTREKVDAYLKKIDFAMLNLRGDAGESFADLATTIADPEDRAIFETYLPNYARTIAEPVEGTWVLMQRLRENGHAIHAITNWSAETWPIGVACHPRLGSSFAVTVVSGEVRVVKPDPQIYATLCQRSGAAPSDCLFIDDNAKNIAAMGRLRRDQPAPSS
jgi:2-haloacid dehalogenase